MTTPFGSAVAPEVKMISAVSSAVISGDGVTRVRRSIRSDLRSTRLQIGRALSMARMIHGLADEKNPRVDDVGDA